MALEPTPEQRAAIEARDRDVLLAAGAGTGKTGVLVERYCAALEELDAEGISPPSDGILAFTFTERAAAELRSRIRGALLERATEAEAGGDDGRARALREAARQMSRAWISTIHGFCRRLLAAHPTRLGLDPRFRVIEAGEARRLASSAFDTSMERLLEGEPARAGMLARFRIRSLRDAVPAIHDELRSQGREPLLPEAREPDPGAALAALRKAAAAAAEECRDAKGSSKADRYRARIDAAVAIGDDPLPASSAVEALLLDAGATDFSGPCARAYDEAVRAASRALVELESRADYEGLRELLATYSDAYAGLKGERSGLDFEDLQLEAVRLLRENPDLRQRYRERFRHLMVDEFQDTNLLQLQLIELLDGEATSLFAVGDRLQAIYGFRHADVGVFRHVRERFKAAPDSEALALPLSGSFRSTPGVVAVVNELGRALSGEDFEPLAVGVERVDEALCESAPIAGGPAAELLVVPAKSGSGSAWSERAKELGLLYGGDNAPAPSRVAEARMLASRLRELADDGVPQRSMVVLLRALTPVPAIEQELRRAGLTPFVVGGRGYWQQQQVDDLRRILGAIANPLDDLALLGALSSPAGGVSPDALWLLRQAAGRGRFWPELERRFGDRESSGDEDENAALIEEIPAEDAERLREFWAKLTMLRSEAPRRPLEELIDLAVSELGYDLAVLRRVDGERRMANIRKLMRMARAYEVAEGRDLRGFLDHLDERSADASEGEAAVDAEGREVVRIMTVHAAKGLEFPVVAFADLGRGLLDGAWPPVVRVGRTAPGAEERDEIAAEEERAAERVGVKMARIGAKAAPIFDYGGLQADADAEASAEALRVAHVAVTRAQCRLILSGRVSPSSLQKGAVKNGTPLLERLLGAWEIGVSEDGAEGSDPVGEVLLREAPAANPRDGLDAGPFDPGEISIRIARPTAEWARSVSSPPGEAPEAAAEAAPAPLLRPIAAPLASVPSTLSYTSIAEFEACRFRFYLERMLGLPVEHASLGRGGDGRRLGIAVHSLLEWSAANGWAEPDDALITQRLERNGLPAKADELERCRELVANWNRSPVRAELDGCEALRPEVSFALAAAGAVVRGQIDLLAPRPDGGALVVDYKTNQLEGADPAELMAKRYSSQRDIYALAAAGSGVKSVETAYVFLERPQQPLRKRYDATELGAARERVEELAASVRSGEFDAASEPSEELCSGCPGRARLCPRWSWRDGALVIERDAAAT